MQLLSIIMNFKYVTAVIALVFLAVYADAQTTELPGPKSETDEVENAVFDDSETVIEPEESFSESPQVQRVENLPERLIVEQEYIKIRSTEHIEDAIPKYRNRRDSWGTVISAHYSLFTPSNYTPTGTTSTFATEYGDGAGALYELTVSRKLNMSIGSVRLGGGVGYSKRDKGSRSLTVIPLRLEGALVLDMLFEEPLVAPYVLAGGYVNIYNETAGVAGVDDADGYTGVAPYFGVGANFQLDWLDKKAALSTFLDYGLQNTFLYIEGRSFVSDGSSTDFSTSFQLAAGAKLEY